MAAKSVGSWLPSVPYPSTLPRGYWEPVTSTLNWCEEDYYATIYSAEIVNTLTNLLFMFLAFKGVANCLRYGHDTVFLIAYIGYLIVGSGSFAFHATLKYPMQLVDELSMIYTTCLMAYATFSYRRSVAFRICLAVSLVALSLFITLYYHYLQDPKFHQNMYALLTVIVVFRCIYVMEVTLRPRWGGKADKTSGNSSGQANGYIRSETEGLRQEKRDKQILKMMWVMIAFGLSIFLGGFGIWNLDNIYCSNLRRWRRQIGLPWGILLEGHGWWHIMTGIGAYFYIVWGIWLRHCLNGKQDLYELDWPRTWSFPRIILKETPQNGHLKKLN